MEELDVLLSQFDECEFTSLLLDSNGLDLRPDPLELPFIDERELPHPHHNEPGPSASVSNSTTSRFSLTDDGLLTAAKESAISKNTAKNTAWFVNVWKEWSRHWQQSHPGNYCEWPIHLYLANDQQLDHWLSKFVLEARKKDGEQYPPNSIYAICCGLQRYVQDHRPY